MKQVGEEEWRRLSEQERQKRLAEMKLKERRLRQEGRMDEAAGLLGGLAETEQGKPFQMPCCWIKDLT